jgi:catalase
MTKRDDEYTRGQGGEIHQQAGGTRPVLTTAQGTPIADDKTSLKAGLRGPTMLEDFILREKITHFDHERIPERVVHARGYGAHGFFEPYQSHAALTRAAFLQDPGERTPVFVRFSTVAGSQGSPDLARDVRGFAVKFYTSEGVFDLVGNNIPVFFIQDAIEFPDLVHSVKPEQDRAFPQAASAHDTFWDYVSLNPASMHMLMWVMSDRAIPRSYRMMEGFGVHTFRMIDAGGNSRFVKFHWRPKLGSFAVLWDEAVKINGADPDFHRRDLWTAIERGDYPEYELGVQIFDEEMANAFGFDVLDPTKLVPEEMIPITKLGRMVLDRNVDEFFAETEQVAFCPSHVVPGIGFTNDPLLQGRLFSYLDTQLSRLGGPNFHEIPINRPKCPWANLQRGGHMRMEVGKGRGAHEPSALDFDGPREDPKRGYTRLQEALSGHTLRLRPESFADHYTQARMFWLSMTQPEQRHIVGAFSFELSKCESLPTRERMLGHLQHTHPDLAAGVADRLGMPVRAQPPAPPVPADPSVPPSPTLSIVAKAPKSVAGKKIGVLVTQGVNGETLETLRDALQKAGAAMEVVAPTIAGVTSSSGTNVPAHHNVEGGPSVLFDAVVVAVGSGGAEVLSNRAAAVAWVADAFAHLKVIGFVADARPLLERARVDFADPGVLALDDDQAVAGFVDACAEHRVWSREPALW